MDNTFITPTHPGGSYIFSDAVTVALMLVCIFQEKYNFAEGVTCAK